MIFLNIKPNFEELFFFQMTLQTKEDYITLLGHYKSRKDVSKAHSLYFQ